MLITVFVQKLRDYSQEQLSEMLDVTPKTISQWENGNSFVKFSKIGALCNVLKISANDLFTFTPGKTGNTFVDEITDIATKIPPAKQQALDIFKTFLN